MITVFVFMVMGLAKVISALVAVPSGEGVTDDTLAYRLVIVIVLP